MWLGLVIAITLLLVPIWCIDHFSHCCDQNANIISRRKDSVWLTVSEILEYLPYPILVGRAWQSRAEKFTPRWTRHRDQAGRSLISDDMLPRHCPLEPPSSFSVPPSEFSELKIVPPSGNHTFKSCVYERLNTVIGHNRKYSRLRNSAFKNNFLCFFKAYQSSFVVAAAAAGD